VVDLRAAREQQEHDCGAGVADRAPKGEAEREQLAAALRANAYLGSFCPLTDDLVEQLVAAAEHRRFASGEVVMRQGDLHSGRLYAVRTGSFEIVGQGRRGTMRELSGAWEARMGPGGSFGELELLYSAPCAATVTAVEDSETWMITHSRFTGILHQVLQARLEGYVEVLKRVGLFSGLYNAELRTLAQGLTEASYDQGEDVVTQGEVGSAFFVLVDGEAAVLVDGEEVERRSASRARGTADFFGDAELLQPGPRLATVRVASPAATVLAVDRAAFELLLKPLDELLEDIANHGDERSPLSTGSTHHERGMKRWDCFGAGDAGAASERLLREDLELCGRIGAGGFGCVDLALHRPTGRSFALKRVRRNALMEEWPRRQILGEKAVLSMTCSPFVVQLHGTFRTGHCLAFLLELLPGGDLLHAFCRHELYGDEACARFFAAGAALALGHLHERRIIHRDLKPENVLLDAAGWPKLSDFGLAKFCAGNTFTLCGTPNYLAPETLLQAGQSEGVDWWALGVLSFEMMAGRTPFEGADGDDAGTAAAIRRGIPDPGMWPWPDGFGQELRDFVSALLRTRASERLPLLPGRLANLQGHRWFRGFDWRHFEARGMEPPCPAPRATPSGAAAGSGGASGWPEAAGLVVGPSEDWDWCAPAAGDGQPPSASDWDADF